MYGFTVQGSKVRTLQVLVNVTHLGKRFTLKEDSYAYDEQRIIGCVADGVSRDFLDGSVVTRDLKGMMKFLNEAYPSPSPAREAADICTKAFIETGSFLQANGLIGEYNQKEGLLLSNYLDKDLAGCTAAGFYEEQGKINWSFICDSGIAVIDSHGNLKFKTPDEGPHSKEKNPYLEEIVKENGGWSNPQARVAIREEYRNNPHRKYAYGALTGEVAAMHYVRQGVQDIGLGDYVLAFTDGVGDILFDRKQVIPSLDSSFLNILKQDNPSALKRFCQERVHTEGTLVVHKTE